MVIVVEVTVVVVEVTLVVEVAKSTQSSVVGSVKLIAVPLDEKSGKLVNVPLLGLYHSPV